MNLGFASLGALPALGAMWYIDRLDAKRPEPRWSLRKVALAGAVAVLPCTILEPLLLKIRVGSPLCFVFFQAFIVSAALEELAKVLCVRWVVWNRPEFDERLDGIVYAARAGLGFALVENVLYLWLQAPTTGVFVGMFVGRALLAVPSHAIFAGYMGYFAARRRFDGTGPGLLGGYLIAVLLHGIYDASVFAAQHVFGPSPALALILSAVPVVVVAAGGWFLRELARKALALDDAAALLAQRAQGA